MKHVTVAILAAILLSIVASDRGSIRNASAQANATASVFQLVNQVRADHALPHFRFNQALSIAAQNQANYNAAHTLYGHSGEGGSWPLDRAAAAGYQGSVIENVVGGWNLTPEQGVTWWVNSPVHYNTLITTRYEEAGIGYAVNGRQRHYTLVVGRPTGAGPEVAADPRQPAGPPALVAPIVLSEPNEDGSIIHEVKLGQTLWAIAARYHVRIGELRLFNNLIETSFIRPGDLLAIRLADGQEPPPTPTPPFSHIVRQGETLWTIAASYQLKLSELLWLNSLDEEYLLLSGEELTIRLAPGHSPPRTPTPKSIHIIEIGETAWEIAAAYNLTLEGLMSLNGLESASILHPGDELRLRTQASPTPTPFGEELPQRNQETIPSTAATTAVALEQSEPLAAVTQLAPETATPEPEFTTPTPSSRIEDQSKSGSMANIALLVAVGFTLLAVIVAGAAYSAR